MPLSIVKTDKCLVGWRGWNIMRPHFLTSASGANGTVWLPGERTEAACFNCFNHTAGEIPGERCTCGIYAFNSPHEIHTQSYDHQVVLGEVWLWGKVIEHERGFKAAYAYPKKLYMKNAGRDVWTGEFMDFLAFRYGVELEYVDDSHPLFNTDPETLERLRLAKLVAAEAAAKAKLMKAMATKAARKGFEDRARKMPSTKGYKNLLDEIEAEVKLEVEKRLEKK